jgi:hypothetical protein
VPRRRLPLLDLGSVTLREGDHGSVAWLPYRLRGALSSPAALRLGGLRALDGRAVGRPLLDLAGGATSGTLAWPVRGDRRDSLARSLTRVTAYGVHGVVAGQATGSVTVLDDDPPPRVRVRAVRDRVREGETLVWVVSWRPAIDYAPFVRRRLVPAHRGLSLTADDLRLGFPAFSEHALDDPSAHRWVVRVPVRHDASPEPREVVRVRVTLPQLGFTTALRGVVRRSR